MAEQNRLILQNLQTSVNKKMRNLVRITEWQEIGLLKYQKREVF